MGLKFELAIPEATPRRSFLVIGLGLLAAWGISGCNLTSESAGSSGEQAATEAPIEFQTTVAETVEALNKLDAISTSAPATVIPSPTLGGSGTLQPTQALAVSPTSIPPSPQAAQTPLALGQEPTIAPEFKPIGATSTPVPGKGVDRAAFDLYCQSLGYERSRLILGIVTAWFCKHPAPSNILEDIDMYDLCLFIFGGGEPRYADGLDPFSWTCNIDYAALEIGTFGGADSQAFGIDPFGNVVGTARSTDGSNRAFIFFTAPCSGFFCLTGMVELYQLNEDLGGIWSRAHALSAKNVVVGTVDIDERAVSFLWDLNANEIAHYLPQFFSVFEDITGDVAVGYGIMDGRARAFRVDLSGAGYYGDLGSFGGDRGSRANATNGKEVVGASADSAGNWHAFWWQPLAVYPDAEMLSLGDLPGDSQSWAFDISASHAPGRSMEVVGYSLNQGGSQRAVLWKAFHNGIDFLVTKLALNSLGGSRSQANAVNSSIQIVGWSENSDGEQHATIWSEDGTVTDLNILISQLVGWDLLIEATDINDAGQIVGVGLYQGQTRAFLLTPTQ